MKLLNVYSTYNPQDTNANIAAFIVSLIIGAIIIAYCLITRTKSKSK